MLYLRGRIKGRPLGKFFLAGQDLASLRVKRGIRAMPV
jgi:hypothetical protein